MVTALLNCHRNCNGYRKKFLKWPLAMVKDSSQNDNLAIENAAAGGPIGKRRLRVNDDT